MTGDQLTLRASSFAVTGCVAEFSHQRPELRNPLSADLKRDYLEVLELVAASPEIRALVITGSGGSFCSGGNVKDLQRRLTESDRPENSPDALRRGILESQRLLARLRDADVPVIAAVDGAAFGAGFGLALQADFIFASTRSVFCMSFARMGAVPDYGSMYILPRLIGLSRAKEIMLTARKVSGTEAQTLGFVHSVHDHASLLQRAHDFAQALGKGPREATGLAKNLINRSFENDYGTMAHLEASAQAIAFSSTFHAESVARFLSKSPPAYDWERDYPDKP